MPKTINPEKLKYILLKFARAINSASLGNVMQEELDAAFPEAPVERWKPKMGENYFFVSGDGEVAETRRIAGSLSDECRYDFGNVYTTRAAAELAAAKIKKILLEG